jgi:hypothetical protein
VALVAKQLQVPQLVAVPINVIDFGAGLAAIQALTFVSLEDSSSCLSREIPADRVVATREDVREPEAQRLLHLGVNQRALHDLSAEVAYILRLIAA